MAHTAAGRDSRGFAAGSEPLIYPEPSSTRHHDLPSFLAYVQRSGLDTKSTTYVGTHYEYTVASRLQRYGFSLRRIGGASDGGIDLVGTWTVPSSQDPVRVLVQCKALSQKIGPSLIRELEGALAGAPVGWRGTGVLGLLVATRPATKGVRESLRRSGWPMAFVACSREGSVQQMLWNGCATDAGLGSLGVTMRYAQDPSDPEQLVLTWQGEHVPLIEPSSASTV